MLMIVLTAARPAAASRLTTGSSMQCTSPRLSLLAGLAALVAACADPPQPPPPECNGYRVDGDGACAIPGLGPAKDVETPDEPYEPPTLDQEAIDAQNAYFLNQEGSGQFEVYVGEQSRIGIRVITASGRPAVGHRVEFELVEVTPDRPSGARLSARNALSNEFGVADVVVVGGEVPAFVRLRMSAPDTAGLTYDINVVQRPAGVPDPLGPDIPPEGEMGGGPLNCLPTKGNYTITNLYAPATLLGDGLAQTLDTVRRALSEPGELVADMIRDRIDGIWGGVIRGAIVPVVDYLFDYVTGNFLPDWAQRALAVTEDVTTLLTQLEIRGRLGLGDQDPADCSFQGVHRWETLVFTWRDGCAPDDPICGRYEVPLDRLGIAASESLFEGRVVRTIGPTATVEIDAHPMRMNLAVAVIWFLETYILPARMGADGFGGALAQVIPCDALGDLVADYLADVPFVGLAVGPFVEDACEAGLDAAGDWIGGQLVQGLEVEAFEMIGSAKLRDIDGDGRPDRVEDGVWRSDLGGTFTGERAP